MRRRAFLATLGSLLTVPTSVRAQPAGKVPRVALLGLQPPQPAVPFIQALEVGLTGAGYTPGQTIILEYHSAESRPERLPGLAVEVARRNVDVIVATTNEVIQAARQATSTIPIVMAAGGDPVGAGFVASLARPGGNITGLTFDAAPDAFAKPLEFLKEAMPGTWRFAVLRNPDPTLRRMVEAAVDTARRLGITVAIIEVRDPTEFEAALATVKLDRIPAVLVWPNGVVYGARRQLIERATRDGLVVASIVRQFAEDGALLAYGPNVLDMFRRAAVYVDKILKGARPGNLPIEQPTQFDLVINLKTAKAFGLTLPRSLLVRADQVID